MTGHSDKSQLDRFKEAARELEADDAEEKFSEKRRKLAKQKPLTVTKIHLKCAEAGR